MLSKRSLCIFCCAVFMLSACVSKSKYVKVKTDLADSREKLVYTQSRLGYTEESREKCIDSLADCQGILKEEKAKSAQLAREIDDLKSDLASKESTIDKQTDIIRRLHDTRKRIENSLREQIETQEVKIEEIEDKLKVILVDKILFHTGSAEIGQRGKEVLLQLADSLRENKDQTVVVEGHTDDVPIGLALMEKYPTNWELSAARAVKVVRFLQEKGWLEPERLSAAAYSHYQPVASNDTAAGRRQNRRIEIVLAPPR